jgi:hypothetical protein
MDSAALPSRPISQPRNTERLFPGSARGLPWDVLLPDSQLVAERDRVAVLNAVQGTPRGEFQFRGSGIAGLRPRPHD